MSQNLFEYHILQGVLGAVDLVSSWSETGIPAPLFVLGVQFWTSKEDNSMGGLWALVLLWELSLYLVSLER